MMREIERLWFTGDAHVRKLEELKGAKKRGGQDAKGTYWKL